MRVDAHVSGASHGRSQAVLRHTALDMRLRTGVVTASIVVLGAFTAGCSGAAPPPGPRTLPSRTVTPSPSVDVSPSTQPSAELNGPAPGMNWVRVSPAQGTPGSTVSLDVACLDKLGAVRSPVLDIGAVAPNPDGHQPWHLFGSATVRPDAAPGRYQISTTCGTSDLYTPFTVLAAPPR